MKIITMGLMAAGVILGVFFFLTYTFAASVLAIIVLFYIGYAWLIKFLENY